MQLAIQETMIAGESPLEKFERAREAGLAGIEVEAEGLTERVPALVEAIQQTGVRVAAVHMGRQDGYIAPELAEREAAINRLRQAFADGVDLGAAHVVFVPHFGPTRMPDLRPYQAPIELEAQMMIRLLRTVSDLAYAMDIELDFMPVCQAESSFLNRLEQGAVLREKIKLHKYVKMAANVSQTVLEEPDWLAALGLNLAHIGYLQVTEAEEQLPGQGRLDFAALAALLGDYEGWVTLASRSDCPWTEVEQSLEYLQQQGYPLTRPR